VIVIDSGYSHLQNPLVATLGFFDGVHTGHRYLIDQVIHEAKKRGLPSAVITFPVHPRKVLNKDYQPALLCGYKEKIDRLSSTGVDYCIVLDFTVELSRLSAQDFMKSMLKDKLNIDTLIIGYDHKFGYNRQDGFKEYKEYGNLIKMNIIQASELESDEHISSTHIRQLLKNGEVEKAAKLLSYNYTISGKIVEGFKVGRTIGFPTANIRIWEEYKVIPALGVYAVNVYIDKTKYKGMLYIGNRPTLHNGDDISLEVNIFDFNSDLYNKTLTVEFIEFVRSDIKFSGIEALRSQIIKDKLKVQEILYKHN